jgi:hypothetical protein
MSKPYNWAVMYFFGSVIIFCSTSGIHRVKCKNKFGNKLYSVISQNWGNKIRKYYANVNHRCGCKNKKTIIHYTNRNGRT